MSSCQPQVPRATSYAAGCRYSPLPPGLAHSPTVSMGKSKVSTGASVAVGSPSRLTILTQPAQGEGWWVGMGWLPSREAIHLLLSPLSSTARSPNPRGTHGQSRLGLCPCPPGSPAGPSLGALLQAEKGDMAQVSHQPPCGPEMTWRTCYRQPLATSAFHSHNSPAGGQDA